VSSHDGRNSGVGEQPHTLSGDVRETSMMWVAKAEGWFAYTRRVYTNVETGRPMLLKFPKGDVVDAPSQYDLRG
jgi:hypothetical protein